MNALSMDTAVASSAQLAQWARTLAQRFSEGIEEIDPHRQAQLLAPWGSLHSASGRAVRQAVLRHWIQDPCEPWPDLERLADPWTRLVLLPRDALLTHLCGLALARRPGALRCCLDARARSDLRRTLGAHFDTLVSLGQGGTALRAGASEWTPMHWSCLGYHDWAQALQPADTVFRRWVRLALNPATLARMGTTTLAPADLTPHQAVTQLRSRGWAWPC